MRHDSLGLFWQDQPKVKATAKRGPREWGPMPSIPETGWRAPTEFPNLSAAKVIGIDTETKDPELTEAGPGWGRGKGHIVGASLSVEDGSRWYFPMRHEVEPEYNMDPDQVLRFLQHTLGGTCMKVGANILYDLGWLSWEGVTVNGPCVDIQHAAALLDSETPHVALDVLAWKHLGQKKESDQLYEWLSRWNGQKANDKQRKWLYKTPPRLAGPYAEADAWLPIQILRKQWPLLQQRGVTDVFDIENRLTPLLMKMRMKGAPVDIPAAEEAKASMERQLDDLQAQMDRMAGHSVNPNAADSLRRAFEAQDIPLPTKKHKKTGETVVSFDKVRMKTVQHPFMDLVQQHKEIAKVAGTFIQSYILDKHVNGRVYCSFHALKGDENGTRSGRLASSDPNLQNIPIRTEVGKLVRTLFKAVHGKRWRALDYSSVEYRILAHFAVGPGAAEVRAIYANDPKADYHAIVGNMIKQITGIVLERGMVKNINFGIMYGMQLAALSALLKLDRPVAKKLLDDYHAAAPYVKETMDMCAREAHTAGMVETIYGRKSDFPYWGPTHFVEGRPSMLFEGAVKEWGLYNIERSMTHKALNRKVQGSAADIMKKAMVDAYEAGLFADDACGMPILTVHDELDFEDEGAVDAPCWAELTHVMENCVADRMTVPLLVDMKHGATWADCK